MVVLPSCIEGILFGRRKKKKVKCKSSWRKEKKKKDKKRQPSHLKWRRFGQARRLPALAPGWERWGHAEAGADPGNGQRPGSGRGGPRGGEHHPSESGGGPGSWVPTRCLKPHPDLWEQPFWGESLTFGGLHSFSCRGRVGGEQLLIQPSTPAVWLHLRAVTRRKKLRVPVGKSL